MVFLGRWRGRPVAVKLIAWDGPGGGTGGVGPVERAVYREIENLPHVDSHHVVRLLGYAVTNRATYLVLELCRHGNVQQVMRSGRLDLDLPGTVSLLLQVCKGLAALNAAGLSHRDVKSSNVLLDCECDGRSGGAGLGAPLMGGPSACRCLAGVGTLKALVGDLGVSKRVSLAAADGGGTARPPGETFVGTPRWMAPERLELARGPGAPDRPAVQAPQRSLSQAERAEKADVYSFGVLAWELAFYLYAGRYQMPFGDDPEAPDGHPGGDEAGYAAGEFDSYLDRTEFNDVSDAGGAFGRTGQPVGTASASPRPSAPHPGASTQGQRELLASLSGRFRRLSATSPPLGSGSGGAASPLSGVPAGPGLQERPDGGGLTLFEKIVRGARPPIPAAADPRLRALIRDCWEPEPRARPALGELERRLAEFAEELADASLVAERRLSDHFPWVRTHDFSSPVLDDDSGSERGAVNVDAK